MAAEVIVRLLRAGRSEGYYAPALSISDSLRTPYAPHIFRHFLVSLLPHIAGSRSQATVLVLVAFDCSPSFYIDFMTRSCLDSLLPNKHNVRILDCYSDPLGWKGDTQLGGGSGTVNSSNNKEEIPVAVCRNVRDANGLLQSIVELGRASDDNSDVLHFIVAIDSISHLLRHVSLQSVASLLSSLRINDQVSSLFWLIHSDLHEPRVLKAFEYIATIVASLESTTDEHIVDHSCNGDQNSASFEWNHCEAKLILRIKRHDGRVKVLSEKVHVRQSGLRFVAKEVASCVINQSIVPKVQFNLHLSDKEWMDRANVVLPFEHQGKGQEIRLYDGRSSLAEACSFPTDELRGAAGVATKGEIHYVRDSDDEQPDSDEDPDDDLDI